MNDWTRQFKLRTSSPPGICAALSINATLA